MRGIVDLYKSEQKRRREEELAEQARQRAEATRQEMERKAQERAQEEGTRRVFNGYKSQAHQLIEQLDIDQKVRRLSAELGLEVRKEEHDSGYDYLVGRRKRVIHETVDSYSTGPTHSTHHSFPYKEVADIWHGVEISVYADKVSLRSGKEEHGIVTDSGGFDQALVKSLSEGLKSERAVEVDKIRSPTPVDYLLNLFRR